MTRKKKLDLLQREFYREAIASERKYSTAFWHFWVKIELDCLSSSDSESEHDRYETVIQSAKRTYQNRRRGRSRTRSRLAARQPRPLSHIDPLSDKAEVPRGRRRFARRIANSRDIAERFGALSHCHSSVSEMELSANDICPETSSFFSYVLNDAEAASKWAEFTSCTEMDQYKMLYGEPQARPRAH